MAIQAARNNPLNVHIGGRIAVRRKMLGLSHASLAFVADTDAESVRLFEQGKIETTSVDLFHLARALNVSVRYFFLNPPPECRLSPIDARRHHRLLC